MLDACRADELARQRTAFEWLGVVGRHPSLASCTWNWMPRTVAATPASVLEKTAYVCANPFSADYCSPDQFHELDEVWRYAWDKRKGTVYPRPVTDRAIHQWRTETPSRMIVHYLQPHVPFLSDDADPLSRNNFDHDIESIPDAWDRVTRGELSRQTAITRYRETLECVLEDVELLLSNIDAERVVITADHGESFGEWGLYGHVNQIDLPCLTSVPWVETSATDRGTHTPTTDETEGTTIKRADQLRALGYSE
ncbi:sulfatase-like hydrolase/transferase [Halococcus thailandensis]|uniref:sulfatase-like hydrolase/transferase n=1 Tax=Halococcus thailandensis TaxID=335952 RepID=UPI000B2082DE|nr:sulfatase-like hydrolase/transferase [Halococcus thailandensis]